MYRIILLFVLSAWGLAAQTPACVKQPPIAIEGVEEFACREMSYEQAWDALTAAGVASVRPTKVVEMGTRTNKASKTQKIITALEWIGFVTPFVSFKLPDNTSDLVRGLVAGVPEATAQGIKLFRSQPADFVQTPADPGFTTIYTAPTPKTIVPGQDVSEPTVAPTPAPGFIPASWYVLYRETARERLQAIESWRVAELAWRGEFNRAEALELISDYQLVAGVQ